MDRTIQVLFIVSFLMQLAKSKGELVCPPNYVEVSTRSSYCFRIFTNQETWNGAKDKCKKNGGELACFGDKLERDELATRCNDQCWVGYTWQTVKWKKSPHLSRADCPDSVVSGIGSGTLGSCARTEKTSSNKLIRYICNQPVAIYLSSYICQKRKIEKEPTSTQSVPAVDTTTTHDETDQDDVYTTGSNTDNHVTNGDINIAALSGAIGSIIFVSIICLILACIIFMKKKKKRSSNKSKSENIKLDSMKNSRDISIEKLLSNHIQEPSKEDFDELEQNDQKRNDINSHLTTAQGRRYNDNKNCVMNINRNILPYDQSRVKLNQPINGIDYINASWIQRVKKDNLYDDVYEFLPYSNINFC